MKKRSIVIIILIVTIFIIITTFIYLYFSPYIKLNGKKKHLGRFVNLQDAINARTVAEEKYFGKFSYNNSIKQ